MVGRINIDISNTTPSSPDSNTPVTRDSVERRSLLFSPADTSHPLLDDTIIMANDTAPTPVTFSDDQFKTFLKTKTPSTDIILDIPRVGGVNSTGAWTGFGSNGKGKKPEGGNCMRAFKCDVLKNYQAVALIEKECIKGFRDQPELLFSLPDESNGNMIVACITAFEDNMIAHGMESVFTIIKHDGTTVNMLQQPGMITASLVDTWTNDVLTDGVYDNDTHFDLCPYDLTNMEWSAKALLNSCSEALKHELKLTVKPGNRYGPALLMEVLNKLYRPSQAKTQELKAQLEKLDIRKFPGENITLFNQAAVKIIREIQMNFMTASQVPDLTTAALTGLMNSSCPYLLDRITTLHIANDVNGFDDTISNQQTGPIECLQQIEKMYRVMVNLKKYGPALQIDAKTKLQAMVAMVNQVVDTKLAQDRTASDTSSSGGRTKRCFDCGDTSHFKGSSDCKQVGAGLFFPNKSGGAAPSGSSGSATIPRHGLDSDTNAKISVLAKAKLLTMPPRAHIPDNADYSISVDGKVMAIYCRHCGRFTKGDSQHSTLAHEGTRNKFAYVPPSGTAPAPAPAPAPSLPPPITAGGNLADLNINLNDVPLATPDDFLHPGATSDIFWQQTSYDFGSSPLQAHLSCVSEDDLLSILVKEYGG